ncbi:MAG: hypothetical protein LBT69_04285 [Lactobacillales bacterium]|jgi:hypothetical protein|nr:hypothetical protein [Lactobacillales bacterium]
MVVVDLFMSVFNKEGSVDRILNQKSKWTSFFVVSFISAVVSTLLVTVTKGDDLTELGNQIHVDQNAEPFFVLLMGLVTFFASFFGATITQGLHSLITFLYSMFTKNTLQKSTWKISAIAFMLYVLYQAFSVILPEEWIEYIKLGHWIQFQSQHMQNFLNNINIFSLLSIGVLVSLYSYISQRSVTRIQKVALFIIVFLVMIVPNYFFNN